MAAVPLTPLAAPAQREANSLAMGCTLVVALLIVGPVAALGEEKFFTPRSYVPYEVGGNGPAAAVDLNGDGRLDLMQSDYNASIRVRVADGAGGFNPPTVIPLPSYLSSFAVGDLTGDGIPDIAAGTEDYGGPTPTSAVRVLPGNGDATFGPAQILPAGVPPTRLSIGDVDADGRQDLIVANSGGNTITIYRSQPGGFAPRVDHATGNYPIQVAVASINGDANPDLIATCYYGYAISLHMGLGGGAFAPMSSIPTANAPWGLAAADLDGDTHPDLVVGNLVIDDCCPGACSIYRGNGDGTFDPPTYHGLGSGTLAVAVADLELDTSPDILAISRTGYAGLQHVVTVLRGADQWGSASQSFYPAAQPDPRSLQLADVDGNGRLDAVVGGLQPYVVVLYAAGAGPFEPWPVAPFNWPLEGIAIADLDQDGHGDLFAGSPPSGPVSVRLGTGDGNFGPVAQFGDLYAARLADLDTDGVLDVVGVDLTNVKTLHGNGDGTFTVGPSFAASYGANGVAAGDLNDDGMVDLVVACDAGHPVPPLAGELAVLLGVGGGNFAPKVVFQNGPWQRPYLADLDVDGDLDLIASGYVFLGHGDGTFDPNPVSWFGIGSGRDDLAIGLIDDDAVPDLVIPIPDIVAPNGLEVRLGLGNGGFGSPTYVNFTEPGSAAVIHDLDGDGHADIAWTTPGTVHVVRGDGHGGFGAPHHYVACGTHGGVAAGDLNGDARPDLAFACVWYSSVALLFNDHPGYPTPTLLAVAAAEALPGLARLTWYGTGAAHLDAMVERRTDTSEWQTIGVPEAIGEDRLRFEDRTVLAGVRYGYRLVVRGGEPEGAGDVVWLAIPVEAGFALTGARPETDGRGLRVYLSLATTEEATLELLDVAGRRVERHAIGAREPGSHEVGVRTDRRLPAGVYMVRLTQGSRSATIKAAIRP